MHLLGQAFFSKLLCERLGAASVRSVALCERDDAVLGPLYEQYDNCEVVVLERREYEHPDEQSSTEQPRIVVESRKASFTGEYGDARDHHTG